MAEQSLSVSLFLFHTHIQSHTHNATGDPCPSVRDQMIPFEQETKYISDIFIYITLMPSLCVCVRACVRACVCPLPFSNR